MIRTMQKNDINAVRKVYSDTRRSEFKWLKDNHLDLSDFDKDTEGEKILVALENSQVVGFISIWEADSFIHHLFFSILWIANTRNTLQLLLCDFKKQI